MLTITDLFCGAGGSSSGAIQVPGVRVRMAANHWKLAVETHNTNHPDADHDCADISQTDPRRYPTTDILWASPECFTAGHLVTTVRGQVPIEDVQVGDMVLTHERRWRPVVRVQARTADTIVVKGQGHTGIEVTPNHRFWMRRSRQVWQNKIRQYRRQYEPANWLAIGEAVDAQSCWATPVATAQLSSEAPPAAFGLDLTAAWWLIGRWVGDGSLTFGRNFEVIITCSFAEADELAARLADTGARWTRRRMRTAEAFTLADRKARDWLMEHFGHGAGRKSLPAWSLSLPHTHRRTLLDGYLSADGGVTQRRVRVSTISRALAVSVRMLAESLGHRVAMAHDKRTTYEIEGRTGAAQVQWILHWEPSLSATRTPEAFVDGGMAWSRVRSVLPGRRGVTVYNIEVDEDHSYVLDGIVVANCTNHSQAKGKKRADQQPDLFDQVLPDEAAERSRATMWDVCRFVEAMKLRGRPYKAFVVENVVEVRNWMYFPAWKMALQVADYCFHEVYLNSMFAQGMGDGAPQSRNRWYGLGHLKTIPCPDLKRWTSPLAWCPACDKQVRAVQAWKRPDRPYGVYKQQYVYRCPTPRCHVEVMPGVLPAAAAIDWSLPGERIGDRVRPLASKTVARIEAGLRRYGRPIHLEAAGNTFERRPGVRSWPVDEPLKTVHTTASKAVACPPMLVPAGGTWNDGAALTTEPFRTRTTRDTEALVVPLRNNNSAKPAASAPLDTVAAAGNHHALVMRNMTARNDPGQMCTPVGEPLRTVLASQIQSVIRWDHVLYGYDSGDLRSVGQPAPTQTTVQGDALLGPSVAVEDCTFRMLEPHEIQLAMAFGSDYQVLGNKRERVRQLGNAVTPPAARDLIAAVVEAISGEPLEVAV